MSEIDNQRLLSFVERVERVDDEIDALKADRKEIIKELKEEGFDVKAFKHIIKERKRTKGERDEERTIFDIYEAAVGIE